jgi:hypothetical protein
VRIVPDNDKSGADHAQDLAKALFGIAESVKIIDLLSICPSLPDKGDISDAYKIMGSIDAFLKLCETTPEYKESAKKAEKPVRTICLSDVAAQSVRWLWQPMIPLGKLTLLMGNPAKGKTMTILAITSIVSQGHNPVRHTYG